MIFIFRLKVDLQRNLFYISTAIQKQRLVFVCFHFINASATFQAIIIAQRQANWRKASSMEHDSNNNQKVFYTIMQRLGADHRYQKILLIVWIFIGITIGSTIFSSPFLLLEQPYKCPHLAKKDCQKFVCSIPKEFRSQYLNNEVISMANSHGDYHCQHKEQLVKVQAFIYIGGIVGVLGGAFLSACLTKKALFVITTLASTIGILLSLFSVNLFMGSIGLFINFAAKGIQIQLIYCYITQTVEESKRAKYQTIIFMFEALGSALNGPVMYVLGNWKTFSMVMYVIPNIIVLFLLFSFIQQTVYDSLIYNSTENTMDMIEKISFINGTTNTHCITLDQVNLIKENFAIKTKGTSENVQTSSSSMLDLFVYGSVRNKMLLVILLGLFVQFNFDGPQLMITEFSMSVFFNGFIMGISQVFSCIVGYWMVDDFERRKMIWISVVLGIIVGLPIMFVSNCTDTCTQFQQIFQSTGLFLFRMAMSFTFTTFILTQFELFPTQIRGMAVQVVSASGYIAVSMIPVVSKLLLKAFNISAISCFLFNCVVIAILTYFIPETFNNPAPDVIEELNETAESVKVKQQKDLHTKMEVDT